MGGLFWARSTPTALVPSPGALIHRPTKGTAQIHLPIAGGVIRVGAFVIADIDSRIYYGPSDFPIAVSVDVEEDLGFKDSLVAFRGGFS